MSVPERPTVDRPRGVHEARVVSAAGVPPSTNRCVRRDGVPARLADLPPAHAARARCTRLPSRSRRPRSPPPRCPRSRFPGTARAPIGAIGYPGVLAQSGATTPLPMASITKVITALVVLEAHPLAVGESGPVATMTSADAALYGTYLAQNGTVANVRAGMTFTELQLLELTLVKSANNYTMSMALWAFGSQDAYLAAVDHLAGLARPDRHRGARADRDQPRQRRAGRPAHRARPDRSRASGDRRHREPQDRRHPAARSAAQHQRAARHQRGRRHQDRHPRRLRGEPAVLGGLPGRRDDGHRDRGRARGPEPRRDRQRHPDAARHRRRQLHRSRSRRGCRDLRDVRVRLGRHDPGRRGRPHDTAHLGRSRRSRPTSTPTMCAPETAGDDVGEVTFTSGPTSVTVDLELAVDLDDPGPWWRLTNPGALF